MCGILFLDILFLERCGTAAGRLGSIVCGSQARSRRSALSSPRLATRRLSSTSLRRGAVLAGQSLQPSSSSRASSRRPSFARWMWTRTKRPRPSAVSGRCRPSRCSAARARCATAPPEMLDVPCVPAPLRGADVRVHPVQVGALQGANPAALRALVQQHAAAAGIDKAACDAAIADVLRRNSPPAARTALSTVLKLVDNVIASPADPKFRRVIKGGRGHQERSAAASHPGPGSPQARQDVQRGGQAADRRRARHAAPRGDRLPRRGREHGPTAGSGRGRSRRRPTRSRPRPRLGSGSGCGGRPARAHKAAQDASPEAFGLLLVGGRSTARRGRSRRLGGRSRRLGGAVGCAVGCFRR